MTDETEKLQDGPETFEEDGEGIEVGKVEIKTSLSPQKEDVATPAGDDEVPHYILPLIVFAQFAGTSLWFAGNAVLSDLIDDLGLPDSSLELLTSAVQLGFIIGTLVFAVGNIADRFKPTIVFMCSALFGAGVNALIPLIVNGLPGMVVLRFLTGFALAGVYPVGMKTAADWYTNGLGYALGFLVGALVLGTAFPFVLRLVPQSWQLLLYETSILAAGGGLVFGFLVPNGPNRKATIKKFDPSVVISLFKSKPFLAASAGYFGHMWELYAFWAWLSPVWEAYLEEQGSNWEDSLVSFVVIAVGGLGCIIGGFISPWKGSAFVAVVSLITSGVCCLLSPLFYLSPPPVNLVFYVIWGMTVVADSPQFSSLVANCTPPEKKGTALTIVNSIGFAITIGSIQLLGVPLSEQYLFVLLVPGPLFGLWHMRYHILPSKEVDQNYVDVSPDDLARGTQK